MTRMEVLSQIEQDEEVYEKFYQLPAALQEEMLAFCMGNQGLKITHDPFFKYIFNPTLHEGRLSEVVSLILGEEVEIVDVLPVESDRISEKGSLLVMDILVKLKSGAFANVEIQKVGYRFQGERCACYSSDLLMRQLSRERAKARKEGKRFSYKSLQKVYTIVLMEKSPTNYWKFPEDYIHHARPVFDTGLELKLLQEYYMIPLDVFKEMPHNKLNKLEAWLYFIGSDAPGDICRVVEAFPEFKEYYNELLMLRYKKKELVRMYDVYREALRAADEGTVQLMIEEQQKEIEEQQKRIKEQQKENQELKVQMEKQQSEMEELQKELERMSALLANMDAKE